MPIYIARFDQDVNGDDSDHWAFSIKAENYDEARNKLVNFIEKDQPEWIQEFNPENKEVKEYFELYGKVEKTAKELFTSCLEDDSIPILLGRYRNDSISVHIEELDIPTDEEEVKWM